MMVSKYESQYGECVCGYVGTMEYHHVIPQCLHWKTSVRPVLVYEPEPNKIHRIALPKDVRIENLMLKMCPRCGRAVHMAFKKYKEE